MIQNLNRLSFQPFGIILADKPESRGWMQELTLTADAAPAWKAEDLSHFPLSGLQSSEHPLDVHNEHPVPFG